MKNIEEKIKKLLRLSKSPHKAEADLALQRAFEIAAKNQIDIETLDLGDESLNEIVSEACRVGYRLTMEKRLAIGIAMQFFNVNCVISKPDVMFFGTEGDIKIALHVVAFLEATLEGCVMEQRMIHGTRFTHNRRRSYTAGFFYGISAMLRKQKETLMLENNQFGLVLRNQEAKRQEKLKEEFPETRCTAMRKIGRCDRDWMNMGYRKGMETRINPAVEERSARLPSLQGSGLAVAAIGCG